MKKQNYVISNYTDHAYQGNWEVIGYKEAIKEAREVFSDCKRNASKQEHVIIDVWKVGGDEEIPVFTLQNRKSCGICY